MLWHFIATQLKTKTKENILRAAEEKWQVTYRGLIWVSREYSSENAESTHQKTQRLKVKHLYSAENIYKQNSISSKNTLQEGEIKTFQVKETKKICWYQICIRKGKFSRIKWSTRRKLESSGMKNTRNVYFV